MPKTKGITFLKDGEGDWSSKRLFALGCLLAAGGLAAFDKSPQVVWAFLTAGSATLGVTALTKT